MRLTTAPTQEIFVQVTTLLAIPAQLGFDAIVDGMRSAIYTVKHRKMQAESEEGMATAPEDLSSAAIPYSWAKEDSTPLKL
jgi:hypothetical protein